ncbi:Hypothetical conserved TPR domain protein [Mycobacteroides abscessus]|nr:Hypothetical conserved TPR domain protein [Mycobacteroides abscessus]
MRAGLIWWSTRWKSPSGTSVPGVSPPQRSANALWASLRRSKLISLCVVLGMAIALSLLVVAVIGSRAAAEAALPLIALPVLIVFALRLVADFVG